MIPAPADRRRIASRIRAGRSEVARRVTADFLARHPGWLDRYGDAAVRFGEEDVGYHLDFLAGAILSRETAAFEGYSAWASRVLANRGITRPHVVENLEQIRLELGRAFPESERALIHRYVTAGIEAVKASRSMEDQLAAPRQTSLVHQYLDAVLSRNRRAALAVAMEALEAGKTVPEIYLEVLTPALYEIGRLWAESEISVGQEHVATAMTQYVVAQLYGRLDVPEPSRGRAVVTGVEGELHQIGGHMVADLLEADGWDVRFLGSHLPNREILDAVEAHEARLLAVSATILANVPTVCDLVQETRERFAGVATLIGGRAFGSGSWDEIGADAVGLALGDAVELARRITSGHPAPHGDA